MLSLAYGALPGVVLAAEEDRASLLQAYATIFIEEEIRREALVKNWGTFLRFIRLAAQESGNIINYTAISQEIGVTLPTVKAHYQLLEDMFLGFTLPAFCKSPRKNLLSTPRFYFFDLGIRNAAAGFTPSLQIPKIQPSLLFEQWVGIELWKRIQYLGKNYKLHFLRTADGLEIDYILETPQEIIPIEVKWTSRPSERDIRHLRSFMATQGKKVKRAFLVCRCSYPQQMSPAITAIPWHRI